MRGLTTSLWCLATGLGVRVLAHALRIETKQRDPAHQGSRPASSPIEQFSAGSMNRRDEFDRADVADAVFALLAVTGHAAVA